MSSMNDNHLDYVAADLAQRRAAHPRHTRLVSANAGSGKTRVLVNRVSRILLAGTAPEKILCLTYTKAAASEMQSRLFSTLGEWSVMSEEKLTGKLRDLLGEKAELPNLKTARALFAKALETPDGLKVQTIHAFCERILSRFPIEAGIFPGFETLEDNAHRALQTRVKEALLRDASKQKTGSLNQALQKLSRDKAEQTIDELFVWMAYNGPKIERWACEGIDPLARALGVEAGTTTKDIARQAWQAYDPKYRRSMVALLGESPLVTDQKVSAKMLSAFSVEEPDEAFNIYLNALLTTSGSFRTKFPTAKADPAAKKFFDKEGPEVARLKTALEAMRGARCLELTQAVFTLATDYAERFKTYKRLDRRLDFGDQINLVRDLLNKSEVSEWVRYKLDGGIDHILVDEAQDTAPEQWDIIDALAAPFFQDSPDRAKDAPRTLFAVGDEKQSIYSFLGAEPERFLDKIQHYTSDIHSGDQKVQQIRMQMSFRSAPEILRFVDQVFVDGLGKQHMFDSERYAPASDLDRHTAHRSDGGRVEFWPLAKKPETEEDREAWDTRPVDALGSADAREQLASAISKTIQIWLTEGEPVFDRQSQRTRPMIPGDILILVGKRKALFNAIIRNLKSEGVAVAGADRIKLKDSIAVQDLLALARFVLLPSDDLSLAETLKSPLFGFDEDALFEVASEREGKSLWSVLQTRRPETAHQLSEMIKFSKNFAPYEFFARVLSALDSAGVSLTQRFYTRLGMEAKDAIEAFLGTALAHQRQGAPSLQHFVQAFLESDAVLKREMDAAKTGDGQVRVMTVHGAKGLEAPVVFLPETTHVPQVRGQLTTFHDGFVLAGSKSERPQALLPYVVAASDREMQEHLRLFYVAMTRAESRLIICGHEIGRKGSVPKSGCWYQDAKSAMEALETETIETPFGTGQAFGTGALPVEIARDPVAMKRQIALPDWTRVKAPSEGLPYKRVTPSHLLAGTEVSDSPARSPLNQKADRRFTRGLLIHKLLEILPEIPRDRQRALGLRFLQSRSETHPNLDLEATLDEVLEILNSEDFSEIFGPGSRAEVSLAGRAKTLPDSLYLNGQIDRLCVLEKTVYIVDYKSNRPPPKTQAGVTPLYMAQMAAYRELAREIYPNKKVHCALLWTDGPNLMVLEDFRLDEALTQVRRLLT